MIAKLKELLGIKPAPNYNELLEAGGIIIDVRTKAEFSGGHIKGAKNIPLQNLGKSLTSLKDKDKPIITGCASGVRSASAKNLLKSNGFTRVYNGGSWVRLQEKIS